MFSLKTPASSSPQRINVSVFVRNPSWCKWDPNLFRYSGASCCVVAQITLLGPTSHIIVNLSQSHFDAAAARASQDHSVIVVLVIRTVGSARHTAGSARRTAWGWKFKDMFTFEVTPGSQIGCRWLQSDRSLPQTYKASLLRLASIQAVRRCPGYKLCTDVISEQLVCEKKAQLIAFQGYKCAIAAVTLLNWHEMFRIVQQWWFRYILSIFEEARIKA